MEATHTNREPAMQTATASLTIADEILFPTSGRVEVYQHGRRWFSRAFVTVNGVEDTCFNLSPETFIGCKFKLVAQEKARVALREAMETGVHKVTRTVAPMTAEAFDATLPRCDDLTIAAWVR